MIKQEQTPDLIQRLRRVVGEKQNYSVPPTGEYTGTVSGWIMKAGKYLTDADLYNLYKLDIITPATYLTKAEEFQKELNLSMVNDAIQRSKVDTNLVSDGYHTFGELYDHRITLYMLLCKLLCPENVVWKSKTHHDGTSWDGWFIMGIGTHKGSQISYHLPMQYWDQCKFADTYAEAPEFDGHTSSDVLERLKSLI